MKIKILDRASLGEDTPIITTLAGLGEIEIYDHTSPSEVVSRCDDADVIIINKVRITNEIISSSKNLKLICVFATGYDNVDIESAKKHGVAVCNVPGYSTNSVALYTAATVLALSTHIMEYNKFVISGEYTKAGLPNRLTPVYHEISGKTWGIIGYGNIGRAVAKVAEALGARVVVYTRTPTTERECLDIESFCRISDIITIHCPLNEGTQNLINKEKIALMKSDAIIVNEARGAVVNEADIAEAIINGQIGAFGCDVYSKEPMVSDHPFVKIMNLPNVLLTPHAAWGSYESRERCISIVADNIRAFNMGKTQNRVDK